MKIINEIKSPYGKRKKKWRRKKIIQEQINDAIKGEKFGAKDIMNNFSL